MTAWRTRAFALASLLVLLPASLCLAGERADVQIADEFYSNSGGPTAGGDEFNSNGGGATGGPMYGSGQYGRDPECGGTDRSYYNRLYNSTAIVLPVEQSQELYRATRGAIWIRCGACGARVICWPQPGYQALITKTLGGKPSAQPKPKSPTQTQAAPASCPTFPRDEAELKRYSPMGLTDIRAADPRLQYMAGLLKGYAECQEQQLKTAPIAAAAALVAQKWRLAARFGTLFCKGSAIAAVANDLLASGQPGDAVYDVAIRDGRLICDSVVAAQVLGPGGSGGQGKPTKQTGPPPTPRLTPSDSGKAMLGEALGYLRAAPPGQRVAMFQDFAAQIAAATKGSWGAQRVDLPGGGTLFAGEYGELLVFDGGGNMFRGNVKNIGTGPDAQFHLGPSGTLVPNYSALRPI